MCKFIKLLFGILLLNTASCTTDDVLNVVEPQDNLLQVPVFSRAALAPTATVVGLDASNNQKFSWELTDPEPQVDNNFWESTTASPSLNGVASLACVVPALNVSGKTATFYPDNDGVLQWGLVPVTSQAEDDRFYINLDYKLGTICVELDFSRSNISVIHNTGGVFNLATGEFQSLLGYRKTVYLTNQDGKYTASISAVPQTFEKGDELLEYSTGAGGYTYTFKADKDYELKAGQTLHIHAYKNNEGWDKDYNPIPTISVTGITLSPTQLEMEKGETEQLTATVSPSNATYKSVTWSSSDTRIATVSSDGLVTALTGGVVDITAKSHNGLTATCQVIVASTIADWEDGGSGSGTLDPE